MTDSHNFQEQFPDSSESDHDPLNFDINQVGEINVEGGEISLNLTECALTAKSIGIDVTKTRRTFLEEAA